MDAALYAAAQKVGAEFYKANQAAIEAALNPPNATGNELANALVSLGCGLEDAFSDGLLAAKAGAPIEEARERAAASA